MSALIDGRATASSTLGKAAATPWRAITTAAILLAGCLALLMAWPLVVDVWRHGAFHDSDDAMRLVQVRALLAGQSWFDMTAYRLDPPLGGSMHWSRVVDLPLAFLIRTFALFTDRATAETLARLVFPAGLLLGLFAGVARLADMLYGPVARIPAIVTTLFCGAAIVQFQPGRISHHAPQIVILILMVGSAVAALDPAKARHAAVAGLLAALSLAISLETLPFIVCLTAMLVAFWSWQGAIMDRMLRAFAAGLGLSLVPLYATTVPPEQWFASVCDAMGAAHLGAGLIGAAGCAILGVISRRLPSRPRRCLAAACVAACVICFVALLYPACLRTPFAQVDPLVRDIWISNVTESLPFPRYFLRDPTGAALAILPVALGLCGCLVAAGWQPGLLRCRYVLLAALSFTGLALTFWQIRVFTSVTPIAILGALPLAIAAQAWLERRGRDLMGSLALCLVFPFTSLAWGMVLPDGVAAGPGNGCLAASAFAPLAALPQGRVLAPIDAGSFILAHTGLSVMSAPYHRNNDGNRFALDTLMAQPPVAVARLRAREIAYVMVCPGFGETAELAKRAPDGLAAVLRAGGVPDGLTRLAVSGTPYWVFSVAPHEK